MTAHRKSSAAIEAVNLDLKKPGAVSTDMLRAFAVYDHLTRFIMPLCSAVPGRVDPDSPVTKMVCVVDISGISLRQVWSLRGYLQDLGNLFANNYPEILDQVLVRIYLCRSNNQVVALVD